MYNYWIANLIEHIIDLLRGLCDRFLGLDRRECHLYHGPPPTHLLLLRLQDRPDLEVEAAKELADHIDRHRHPSGSGCLHDCPPGDERRQVHLPVYLDPLYALRAFDCGCERAYQTERDQGERQVSETSSPGVRNQTGHQFSLLTYSRAIYYIYIIYTN